MGGGVIAYTVISYGPNTMTQPNDLSGRVNRLENDAIDIKMAIIALLSAVEIQQRDMGVFRVNAEAMLHTMNQSLQRMEIMESDIRGLQTENRRILDVLQQRNSDDI